MVKRPWSVMKYMASPFLMTAWAKDVFDFQMTNGRSWKDVAFFFIRKSNTMVPLPVKTETGKPDWVNLEWFFPGQMWLSLARNVSDHNLWEATRDIGMEILS